MLNNELENYKILYARFLDELLDYHNRHSEFIHRVTDMGGIDMRRNLRKLRELEAKMMKASVAAYNEMKEQRTARLQLQKEKTNQRKENGSNYY